MRGLGGVVLAGGRSSRMGRDKALLTWQGRPWAWRARELLVRAGCEEVVFSGPARPGLDGEWIEDQTGWEGPMAGVLTCLARLKAPALFLPVDMPHCPVAALRRLARAYRGQPVLAWAGPRGPEPFPSIWGPQALERARSFRSPRALLLELGPGAWLRRKRVLTSLNRPQDLPGEAGRA